MSSLPSLRLTMYMIFYVQASPSVFAYFFGQIRNADIVVSAAGRPGLVKGHWIKPGAVVVDVAMNAVGRHKRALD